jgi:TRAP transporter 4TM/12TM fusion protein
MTKNMSSGKKTALFVSVLAVCMALFHLYTSGFGRFPALQQRSIHLAFALILTFFIYPFRKKGGGKGALAVNILFSMGTLLSCGNITFVIYYVLYERAGAATLIDIVLGCILIILVMDMTRRIMGWALPIITLVFISYGFLGSYIHIPYLAHSGMDISRFISYEYLSTEGLFTVPLGVSATFIAIFVIFAAFLIDSGVGDFFMEAATAIAGDKTGGPAKVAVVSSALMGSVSGSAVGNVVTTGSVTIPLMKRMGFPPLLAAGIEATASTGGQIMPPLMGAAAFIIASIVGKSYLIICIAAFVPAVLSFVSVFVMVHFEAERYGIKGLPKESLPKLLPVLKKRGHLVLPIVVLVALLVTGATAMKAGFYSIIAVFVMSSLQKDTRMNLKKIFLALENGAKAILPIAAACACSGIVVGILTLTGLGLKLSYLLVQIAHGSLPVLLVLAMLASILLGMGITTTAAYLLVAIILAPVLVNMGVPELAAHMFVFYYAVISTITPPVALAAYAAAGIAKTDPLKTALVGFRIGIAKFVVPFYVIYTPEIMLLWGKPFKIAWALVMSFLGIWALAAGACGYVFREIRFYERLLLFACIPLTIPHNLLWNTIGGGIIFFYSLFLWRSQHGKNKQLATLHSAAG